MRPSFTITLIKRLYNYSSTCVASYSSAHNMNQVGNSLSARVGRVNILQGSVIQARRRRRPMTRRRSRPWPPSPGKTPAEGRTRADKVLTQGQEQRAPSSALSLRREPERRFLEAAQDPEATDRSPQDSPDGCHVDGILAGSITRLVMLSDAVSESDLHGVMTAGWPRPGAPAAGRSCPTAGHRSEASCRRRPRCRRCRARRSPREIWLAPVRLDETEKFSSRRRAGRAQCAAGRSERCSGGTLWTLMPPLSLNAAIASPHVMGVSWCDMRSHSSSSSKYQDAQSAS